MTDTDINEYAAEYEQMELFAKEIFRRVLGEQEPEEIRTWMAESVARMGGDTKGDAVMTWAESFEFTNRMIEKYEQLARIPKKDRKILDFPWTSWNKLINPLSPGIMMTITAPDGQGKSLISESIAEHWAEHKNKVAFVHYELNQEIMMQRRTARHAYIPARAITDGNLTPQEKDIIDSIMPKLMSWDGDITYVHTPGWTIDKTLDELRKIQVESGLDVVVIDYLEKIYPSRRQLKMYGSNVYQREADNVEQLKNFAESTGIPVLMVAQMNKQAKRDESKDRTSASMTGTGEKSNKSNVVVLLSRERTDGHYSDEVNVTVDKNTMGATGTFKQMMIPQFFRLEDIDAIQEVK